MMADPRQEGRDLRGCAKGKNMQPLKISEASPFRTFQSGLQLVDAAQPLDALLASGGDGRLVLNARDGAMSMAARHFPAPACWILPLPPPAVFRKQPIAVRKKPRPGCG